MQVYFLIKIKKVMFHSKIMQVLIKSLLTEPGFYYIIQGGGTV